MKDHPSFLCPMIQLLCSDQQRPPPPYPQLLCRWFRDQQRPGARVRHRERRPVLDVAAEDHGGGHTQQPGVPRDYKACPRGKWQCVDLRGYDSGPTAWMSLWEQVDLVLWSLLQVLVLGCGMQVEQVPKDVAEYLRKMNIKVEVLDSVS